MTKGGDMEGTKEDEVMGHVVYWDESALADSNMIIFTMMTSDSGRVPCI